LNELPGYAISVSAPDWFVFPLIYDLPRISPLVVSVCLTQTRSISTKTDKSRKSYHMVLLSSACKIAHHLAERQLSDAGGAGTTFF
jgi:hypothetical protein